LVIEGTHRAPYVLIATDNGPAMSYAAPLGRFGGADGNESEGWEQKDGQETSGDECRSCDRRYGVDRQSN